MTKRFWNFVARWAFLFFCVAPGAAQSLPAVQIAYADTALNGNEFEALLWHNPEIERAHLPATLTRCRLAGLQISQAAGGLTTRLAEQSRLSLDDAVQNQSVLIAPVEWETFQEFAVASNQWQTRTRLVVLAYEINWQLARPLKEESELPDAEYIPVTGQSLAEKQIERGLGWITSFPGKEIPALDLAAFSHAQQQAQQMKKGVWLYAATPWNPPSFERPTTDKPRPTMPTRKH